SNLVPVERQVIWQCSQVEIVGREIFSRALARTTNLGALQSRLDNGGYAPSDLVLKIEHIFERPLQAGRPEMPSGRCINYRRGDTDPTASFAHRAFEHVAHTQLATDLFHINGLPLVRKTRIAGDHEEPADAGECRYNLFDHAVGEVVLLRVATHVGEGR